MRAVTVVTLLAMCAWSVAAGQPVDTWFIFIDELHVQFRDTGRLRTLVQGVTTQILHDGALYELRTSGASNAAIGFTRDATALIPAIKKLTGQGLRDEDVAPDVGSPGSQRETVRRMDRSISALRDALADLTDREGPPGSLLVVSSRLFEWPAYRERWAAALRPVIRPDTQLYLLDPRDEDGTPDERLQRGRVILRR